MMNRDEFREVFFSNNEFYKRGNIFKVRKVLPPMYPLSDFLVVFYKVTDGKIGRDRVQDLVSFCRKYSTAN